MGLVAAERVFKLFDNTNFSEKPVILSKTN